MPGEGVEPEGCVDEFTEIKFSADLDVHGKVGPFLAQDKLFPVFDVNESWIETLRIVFSYFR